MMLFVAVMATLNLCVGYVLGAYFGVLPGLPTRLALASWGGGNSNQGAASTVSASPPVAPTSTTAAAPARVVDPAEVTQEILAGLASFRQKLAKVNDHLHQSEGDRASIDTCAGELRHANDQYMSDADRALERLEAVESDPQHDELKLTLTQQAEEVKQVNTTLDQLLENPDTELVHRRLLETTGHLDEGASVTEQKATEVLAPPPVTPTLLAAMTVPLQRLLDSATQQLQQVDGSQPLQMGAVRIDDLPASTDDDTRLAEGLLQMVESVLMEGQMAALGDDGVVLMLLAGDDEAAAIQRCERLRQLTAASVLECDGNTIRVTATCTIATAPAGTPVEQVVARLHESLAEARRYGPNRCLHHDGKFPAPVVPHTMDVVGMTVAV